MDKQGFRTILLRRQIPEEKIDPAIALAERFEAFLMDKVPTAEKAWAFSKELIEEGNNTKENYIALIRYCLFIKNHEMYVALLELVDGGEVGHNLYLRSGERFGNEVRDEIFSGIGVAPYGTPTPEKPAYLLPVIERLGAKVGEQACADFLSASLRNLPDEYFLDEREKYRQASGIDAYLAQRKETFIAQLETCLREGRPFFAQEITQAVIDFVRSEAEMGGGQREGKIVYETKIPFMTREYLAESDPTMKRYYACHCPWAREAIKDGSVRLVPIFCNCSAGFHKKPFESAFGQPVKVDVLESALMGHDRCRFAIHLPDEAIP